MPRHAMMNSSLAKVCAALAGGRSVVCGLVAVMLLALPVERGLAEATEAGDGEFAMHARVSFDAGGTVVRGEEDDEWAFAPTNTLVLPGDTVWADDGSTSELEFPRGTFVRLADGSHVHVRDIGATMALRGEIGSFYIQRLSRSTGDVVFETPAGTIEIVRGTTLRVDVEDDGSATISVSEGHATVRGEAGEPVAVTAGQRVWVDPGLMPSEAVRFDADEQDAFDRWHAQRVDVLTTGTARTPLPDGLQIHDETLGVSDLANYGEWVHIDNRPYWRPTVVVNYVPYRHGHWTHVPRAGQVWIGRYPFAHVTTHYGTWRHTTTYGWVWSYHGQWSPAWATAIRYRDHYIWTPIDRHHRPAIVHSSASFTVGGVRFSLGASSFAPVTRIYTGPVHVRPLPVTVVRHIHRHRHHVHVWHLGPRHRHVVRVPYARTVHVHVHEHRGHRWVRGPHVVVRGDRSVVARSRGMVLDQRLRTRQFSTAPSRPERGIVHRSDRDGRDHVRSRAGRERGERAERRRTVQITQQEPDFERRMQRQRLQRDERDVERGGPTRPTRDAGRRGRDRSETDRGIEPHRERSRDAGSGPRTITRFGDAERSSAEDRSRSRPDRRRDARGSEREAGTLERDTPRRRAIIRSTPRDTSRAADADQDRPRRTAPRDRAERRTFERAEQRTEQRAREREERAERTERRPTRERSRQRSRDGADRPRAGSSIQASPDADSTRPRFQQRSEPERSDERVRSRAERRSADEARPRRDRSAEDRADRPRARERSTDQTREARPSRRPARDTANSNRGRGGPRSGGDDAQRGESQRGERGGRGRGR